MVRQLHDGVTAGVRDNGAISKAFAMTNGVKWGCVFAPNFENLMLSAILVDAYRNVRIGIRIVYGTDGNLTNRRIQAPPRDYLRLPSKTWPSPTTARSAPRPK
ncbi:hypothetical protein SprV_0501931000 [Sparganum proliferum]